MKPYKEFVSEVESGKVNLKELIQQRNDLNDNYDLMNLAMYLVLSEHDANLGLKIMLDLYPKISFDDESEDDWHEMENNIEEFIIKRGNKQTIEYLKSKVEKEDDNYLKGKYSNFIKLIKK